MTHYVGVNLTTLKIILFKTSVFPSSAGTAVTCASSEIGPITNSTARRNHGHVPANPLTADIVHRSDDICFGLAGSFLGTCYPSQTVTLHANITHCTLMVIVGPHVVIIVLTKPFQLVLYRMFQMV